MFQHTGEEVQLGLTGRRGWCQAINSIADVQQQEHDRGGRVELSPLGVRLVDLLHSTAQQVGVEAQAIAKHLDVRYFDVDLALVGVGKVDWALARVVSEPCRDLGAAAQVDVHRLEKGLPPVAQQ